MSCIIVCEFFLFPLFLPCYSPSDHTKPKAAATFVCKPNRRDNRSSQLIQQKTTQNYLPTKETYRSIKLFHLHHSEFIFHIFRNIKIHLHFLSFLNTEMAHWWQGLIYSIPYAIHSINQIWFNFGVVVNQLKYVPVTALLMFWWCEEQGHQQPWYWTSSPREFHYPHQNG